TRTRAGLKNIDRKMLVQLAFDYLFRRLNNEISLFFIKFAEVAVCLRGSPLDKPQCANQGSAQPISAYRKVKNSPLRRSTVQCVGWHFHRTHRILFDSRLHMKGIT